MGATLLLADDSITIQRVIELTFADEDIRVIVASDGQQAIQKIESERPDIVLADIGMPRVDGYAVAAHVKQSASLKHIPVILLTGAFEPVDEARARKTGCDGVLVKPFEPQKLVARVKELLRGARSEQLWPAEMPRAQAAPPLSVPAAHAGEIDPVFEPLPVFDSVFDLGEAAAAPAEPVAALEGDDVANRNGDQGHRQLRRELPPPVDRLDTELDMLDAALSRLDPTAHPHELDEATASDFARDLNELRNEAREEDAQMPRPSRPSFGSWDLPQPTNGEIIVDTPIDVVAEKIPLVQVPSPEVQAPPPVVQMAPPVAQAPPAVVRAPPPAAAEITPHIAPAPAPAPVVDTPAPVVPVPVAAPVYPAPAAPAAPAASAAPASPAAPAAPAPPIERPTLAAAFSALLAAEKSRPAAHAAPAQLSEAAIEEVVRRVLARMAGDTVNRLVLETAERMIRDEISRTKDPSGR